MILTLLLLAEMFGRQRAWILGFLVGAAFLSRAPVAFATPALALWLLAAPPAVEGRLPFRERFALLPWRNWALLGLGLVPPLVFFFGTTSRASARRRSPATPWQRCRSGWRTSASSGCSPWPTCG